MGRSHRTSRAHRSVRCTAWNRLNAAAFRAPAGTSPAAPRCRYPPVSESAHSRSSIGLLRELSVLPDAHVLGQLIVKIDGAALAIRVGLGARESQRLHALLHSGHVREVLRQHGQPPRIANGGVDPFRLRLFVFGIELEYRYLEDALVR